MKYLIDAQLPHLLADVLRSKGFDVVHTDDLPDKDETSDIIIRLLAVSDDRVVITKDSDFQDSYLIFKEPPKLLLLTTGNIKNRPLLDLFRRMILTIDNLFEQYCFIELNNEELIVHE